MKPMVLVTAPVGTRSGYGAHSRDICRSLIALDKYDVRIWPVRWGNTPQNALSEQNEEDKPIIQRLLSSAEVERQPDIHFHIVVPNEFQPIAKYNIGVTAGIETTVVPPEWIEGLNKMDLNIVPANFVKQTIENTKFDKHDQKTEKMIGQLKNEKPVEVLFEGADTNLFKLTREFSKDLLAEMNKIKEDFCFLHVGHWLQGGVGEDRKDIGMLVRTFFETFKNQKEKPALILKTSGATPCILDREELMDKVDNIKRAMGKANLPNVYILHGDLRDEEMNQLYSHPKVKAHVSFTHGEGFGRPLLEASLSEKPVIASNWSGHIDFLTNDSILLPGNLVDTPKGSFPKEFVVEGAKWFQVNYQYASNVLKEIYKNYSKYIMKAKKQAIINRTKFSLDAMTIELDNILQKYLPKFESQPQKVDLKLPKLKKVTPPKKVELPKLKKVN